MTRSKKLARKDGVQDGAGGMNRLVHTGGMNCMVNAGDRI